MGSVVGGIKVIAKLALMVGVLLGVVAGGQTGAATTSVTFSQPTGSPFPTGGSSPQGVTSGDLNGDGKLDLAAANQGSNTVSVLLGKGDGTFQAPQIFPTGEGTEPQSITNADLNGDGKLDLATANLASNDVSVLLGNGDGTFQAPQTFITGGTALESITSAVLNGDGKLDLATANSSDNVSVLLGNGHGTFQDPQSFAAGSGPVSITSADLNSDRKSDLATANQSSNDVSVLLNTTPFPTPPSLPGGGGGHHKHHHKGGKHHH